RSRILTAVVHQDDAEGAGIVLPQQRADARGDAVRLVARRHDGGDGRPGGRRRHFAVVALGTAPELAAAEQQVEPNAETCQRNRIKYHGDLILPPEAVYSTTGGDGLTLSGLVG